MMGSFENWADFGIAGILALALILVIRFGLTKFEKIVETFSDDLKEMRKEHREDRKEWHDVMFQREEIERQSQERRDSALTAALNGLKDAITEQNNRQRKTDFKI